MIPHENEQGRSSALCLLKPWFTHQMEQGGPRLGHPYVLEEVLTKDGLKVVFQIMLNGIGCSFRSVSDI
jgi:hypothetical protein